MQFASPLPVTFVLDHLVLIAVAFPTAVSIFVVAAVVFAVGFVVVVVLVVIGVNIVLGSIPS